MLCFTTHFNYLKSLDDTEDLYKKNVQPQRYLQVKLKQTTLERKKKKYAYKTNVYIKTANSRSRTCFCFIRKAGKIKIYPHFFSEHVTRIM